MQAGTGGTDIRWSIQSGDFSVCGMALYCAGSAYGGVLCVYYIKEDMCSKYNHLKEENKMSRVYNFSAGPAVLPEDVLKEAAAEMLDYRGNRNVSDGDESSI